MELRIGPPATGDNFYQRPELIGKIRRALQRGNVAFLGPRRTGKTSCLEEIKKNPDGFIPILLDLEKHDTVEAWLVDMVSALRLAMEQPRPTIPWATDKVTTFLGRINRIEVPAFAGLGLTDRKADVQWRKSADEFLSLLAETDVPVIFLLDEFPTFLKLLAKKTSRDEVEALLNWFRAARQSLNSRKARFLVTGSIGLKGVVRKMGLSPAINEFDNLEIPPLTDKEADGLLEDLAEHYKIPLGPEGRLQILQLLGGNWPILIQLFVSELQEAGLGRIPTKEEINQIYTERLVGGSRNQYCEGMYDRMAETFSVSECRLAREILKATSRAGDGLSRSDFENIHARLVPDPSVRAMSPEDLDYVLETLKHDGYLRQSLGGHQKTFFGSNILRDFWIRKTA